MATLWESFLQPAVGTQPYSTFRRVTFIGDPVFSLDQTIWFPNYGIYLVKSIVSDGELFKAYDLYFISRDAQSPNAIPKGTEAVSQGEGVTHSVLTYNSPIALPFQGRDYRTLTLTGDLTINTNNHAPAKSVVVKIRNSSGTLSRNMTFPPSWIFLGPSGRPSTIAPSRTGILSITCFGTSDADVIAVWAVQA